MRESGKLKTCLYSGIIAVFLVATGLLFASGAIAQSEIRDPSVKESRAVEPDYAELADTFFTSLGKDSPVLLEKYQKIRSALADTGALARVGGYLSAGDYGDAYQEIRKFVGDKMIDSIPVLGAMGKLGVGLGNWATDHFGKGRFDSLYEASKTRLDAGDWAQGFDSGFVQALITEGTKGGNIYSWLNEKSGQNRSREENEKLLWKILKAKHEFNKLCDKYHLQGEDRSYDILKIYIEADIRSAARQAVRREKRKAEDRAFFKNKKLKDKREREKRQAEHDKKVCKIWLGRVKDPDSGTSYEDRPGNDQIFQQCGERPKTPDNTTEPASVSNDSSSDGLTGNGADLSADAATPVKPRIVLKPKKPEVNVHDGIFVTVTRETVGDSTFCKVMVMNTSQKPMRSLSLSVEATAPYKSGGTGGGGKATLGPGEIHSFIVFSSGEAKGSRGSFTLGGKSLGEVTCYSAHEAPQETGINPAAVVNPNGTYTGGIKGGISRGGITIIISGRNIKGEIGGTFESMGDFGTIGARIKGSFDPVHGVLSGTFEGSALNKKDGKTEGISGSLKGVLTGNVLSGSWEGSASLAFDEGRWSAAK